jgi:hypothetical protein
MALNLLRRRFRRGVENNPEDLLKISAPEEVGSKNLQEDSLFGELLPRPRGVSARVLHALRKMRDKPESLLLNPEKAYSLLVHAVREAELYSHEQVDISENQQQPSTPTSSSSSAFATALVDPQAIGNDDASGADDDDELSDEDSDDSNGEQSQNVPSRPPTINPTASSSRSASFSSAVSPIRDQKKEVKRQLRADCNVPIRKVSWIRFAPRYMPLLCDAYCADKVFDVLTQNAPLRLVNTALSSERVASEKNLSTSRYEKLLTFDVFERYIKALAKTLLGSHSAWDGLREALELEPNELCVKVEKYVECFLEFSVHSRIEVRKGNTSRVFEVPVSSVSDLPVKLPAVFEESKISSSNAIKTPPAQRGANANANVTDLSANNAVNAPTSLRQFIKEREVAEAAAKRAALYASDSGPDSSSDDDPDEKENTATTDANNTSRRKRSGKKAFQTSFSSPTGPNITPDTSSSTSKSVAATSLDENEESALDDSASLVFDAEGEATLTADEVAEGDQAFSWELEALVQEDAEGGAMLEDEGGDEVLAVDGDDDGSYMGQGVTNGDLGIGSVDSVIGGDDDALATEVEESAAADTDAQGLDQVVSGSSPLNPTIEKKRGSLRGALGWLSQTSSKLRTSVAVVAAAQKDKTKKLLQRVGERAKAVIKGSPLKANASSLGAAAAETLRLTSASRAYAALGLHPAAASSLLSRGTTTLKLRGTFILTNKSMYFIANRNEAIIIPLHSVPGLEDCTTTVKTLGFNRKIDNGLRLTGCDVQRAAFDPEKDLDALSSSALKTLFVLSEALEGQTIPLNSAALNERQTRASISSPSVTSSFSVTDEIRAISGPLVDAALDEVAKAASSTGASIPGSDTFVLNSRARVRPQVSFTFSRLKDLIVSRGNERKSGGRRKVIKDAVTELLAAQRLTALYEAMLTHHLEDRREDTRLRRGRSRINTFSSELTDTTSLGASPSINRSGLHLSMISLGLSPVSSGFSLKNINPRKVPFPAEDMKLLLQLSPNQIDMALGKLTLTSLMTLPWSSNAWKEHLDSKNRPPLSASFSRRLSLYASLSVIRERSLLKATRKTTSVLQLCSHACPPLIIPPNTTDGAVASTPIIPDPAETLVLSTTFVEATSFIRRIMLVDDPLWLAHLTSRMSKEKMITIRRAEKVSLFEMRRLKAELDTFLDAVVFPLNVIFRRGPQYIMSFKNPVLSLSAMTIVAAWLLVEDLHKNTFSLLFLLPACGLLAYGSINDAHRAFFLDLCTRERKPRAKNIIERLTRFRTTLGENQARLRRVNTIMLKLKSLVTWRDEARTSIFVAFLFAIGILVNVVPLRLLIGIYFAFLVRKKLLQPLSSGPGVGTLVFARWYEGLRTQDERRGMIDS